MKGDGSEANYFHHASSLHATYSSVNGSTTRNITNRQITSGSGVTWAFNSGWVEYDPNSGTHVQYNLTRTIAEYTGIAGGRVTISGISAAFLSSQLGVEFGVSFAKSGVGFSIVPVNRWYIGHEPLPQTIRL